MRYNAARPDRSAIGRAVQGAVGPYPPGSSKQQEALVSEIIFVVEESPEGGYEARAASASIYTEADTLDELRTMVRDAVECHFESEDRPKLIRLHFVREEVLAA